MNFEDLVRSDIKDVFLKEYSQVAIYTPSQGSPIEVTVQFFEDSLDQLDTTYFHIWTSFANILHVAKNDKFEVNTIVYGVISTSPDEFGDGVNVLLQKV